MTAPRRERGEAGGRSDAELLRIACSQPDAPQSRRAAGDLLMRYQSRVYAWCWHFVRDHERALDMAQEVMLLAYRALPSFEGRSRFSSWLFIITRRRCLREVRRLSLWTDDDVDPDGQPGPHPGPEERMEAIQAENETLDMLQRILDPRERTAIWLRCYEGLGVSEITEVLGIQDRSGARSVLQSARRKLRQELERRHRVEDES